MGLGTLAVSAPGDPTTGRTHLMHEITMDQVMSPSVHTIGKQQTLAFAHEEMRRLRIRHLPVLDGGHVVGIVTERDLHLVETLRDVDSERVTVDDAMTPDPYVVAPGATLRHVAREMADRKLGAAVVARGSHVVGVFTTVDALRVLATTLGDDARLRDCGP